MPSNKSLVVVIVALAAGFTYGLWKLYALRFEAGDIYPPYSSLRADPLGAKALYESLAQIPGVSAARNYLPLTHIPKDSSTVLFLGEDPFLFDAAPEDEIKAFEDLARGGARVVIAMRPVNRLPEETNKSQPKPDAKKPREGLPLEKRWGVRFEYITRSAKQAAEDTGSQPKLTALYFRSEGKVLYRVERPFGRGVVALLANCYPLSNEALAGERDIRLLAWTLGENHRILFDENHFGIEDSSGIVTLARKYRLQGLGAVLLVLLALFIWKNSTSLLPPRVEQDNPDESVMAKDTSSGLANLLRRNVPVKALMSTCVEQWEAAQHGGRFYSQAKIERVRALGARENDPVEAYCKASRILADRRDG